MASPVHVAVGMIATEPLHDVQTSTLKIGTGFTTGPDARRAILEATEVARAGLRGATAHMALVVTAGLSGADPVPLVRSVIGPVGVAGGATTGLMTEAGMATEGALVILMATEGDATNGAAAVPGKHAGEAGSSAARIVMAGWPFRLRYPRGLGVAFTGVGTPREFLEAWRQFMGPKMRTVCGVMPGGVLYGAQTMEPAVSVACLEASYSTGLGYADGFEGGADPTVLAEGATDAVTTAIKRLNERPARLVLVLESAARHEALGAAAAQDAWHRMQVEAGERVPCLGWICERVDGYGRGIQPVDQVGSLIVAAVGDGPSAGHSGSE